MIWVNKSDNCHIRNISKHKRFKRGGSRDPIFVTNVNKSPVTNSQNQPLIEEIHAPMQATLNKRGCTTQFAIENIVTDEVFPTKDLEGKRRQVLN